MLAATQNVNANKHNQLKITKKTLIYKLCCSCVRLLVHRFILSMLPGKYLALYMLAMKIFFRILFVWQVNDLVFSSEFEKIALQKKQQHENSPLLYKHTTKNKIQHDKVSISGPQGKGTQIFYKTKQSRVIVDFIVED